jgi:ubiquitin carboxyl-terminal hydrolase 9/13
VALAYVLTEEHLANLTDLQFGNTCYCNSIVQALYYSVPFREHVVKYPPHSPYDTPNGNEKHLVVNKAMNGGTTGPGITKGTTAADAAKRRSAALSAPATTTPGGMPKPEDKPDSPEYKKKQAMLMGPILDLTYENASAYGMEESTFTALKDVFTAMIKSHSRTGVVSPQRFLEIFKRDNEMFRTAMHQDAHEFYGLVLNAVITNVEENSRRFKELEAQRQNQHDEVGLAQGMANAMSQAAHAMGMTNGVHTPSTGWVHDIFEGVLTSETKCLTCETTSQRSETFLDLSIDLEENSSVTSCLRKFSAEEMLCERNKFHCDNCGGLQEAEKRMKIKKLPKILTLHLKRFEYTEDMTRLQKLFHRVVYPYHLRMFNTTDDAEEPDRLYELYAVVVHIGGNAYHGHYVSIIKTQDRGWLLFDDEMVEPVDKHYVRNFFGDKPGMATAYVLFYQETTLEAMQREQEAEGLAEVQLATTEAEISLGHPQAEGTHPSSISKQVTLPPMLVREELPSLEHAMTSPVLSPSPSLPSNPLSPESLHSSLHSTPLLGRRDPTKSGKIDKNDKEKREREKKEAKEAEKARKVAEKEKAKQDEKDRKEAERKRKEADQERIKAEKAQADEYKAAMAASKASAAEEEERRKREEKERPAQDGVKDQKENGLLSGLNLSRNKVGSKSTSRRSLAWLGKDKAHSEAVIDGDGVPPVPQLPGGGQGSGNGESREKKERFSFSLGRKKSTILSP